MDRSSSAAALVVGSLALDSVKTPMGERREALGGSAAYFALAAARYGPVRLVAVAGTDFPEEYTEMLRDQQIDLEGLEVRKGRTFRWEGVYSEDMNDRETLRTELNVFEGFHPKLPESYRRTPCVLLANIDPMLQLEVLEQMEAPRFVALDTMNFWITSRRNELLEVLRRVDAFFVNDSEALLLTEATNVLDAAEQIATLGPKVVVIKRGEYGVMARTPEGWFALPAYPVRSLCDPTGAGDSFAGGVLGYLMATGAGLEDDCLRRGLAHGTAVASHVVEHFSVDGLLSLERRDIEERVRQLRELVHFDPEEAGE